MKLYRSLSIVLALGSIGLATPGMLQAETPPWWDDAAERAPAPAADDAERRSSQSEQPVGGPILEEYPISIESVAMRDEREQTANVAAPSADADAALRYLVQPGDVLRISVWREPELARELTVSPDGRITYPLVGEVLVEGVTVEALRATLEQQLHRFIKEALVDVSVKEPLGNRVYVLGKVNRPGAYPFTKSIDVAQALSLAGGTAKFASIDDIRILRRIDGQQQAFAFRYSDVERGRSLEQNIVLRSGDIVVVP